jgi:3-hydroxyisobutyrate dehydrogenase-like beta-hydroxyacid dehydrogenase
MTTIAVVGLGAMGAPIARNLIRAGHDVVVWNRSSAPAEALAADGARVAADLVEAFQAPVVVSMLSNDAVVATTLLDPELLARAARGTLHVNMATISPELADRAASLHAEHGLGYVAAPVFGRVPAAEAGELNVLAAGAPEHVAAVLPVLEVLGRRVFRVGDEPRRGNLVKILGNYLIATSIQGLAEVMTLGEANGLSARDVYEVLTETIVGGVAHRSYGALIADSSYRPAGFTTTLGFKDVNLALDEARSAGLRMPLGEALTGVFTEALDAGQAEWDWAGIAEVQRRRLQG